MVKLPITNHQLPMRGVIKAILVVVIAVGVCIILAVVIIGRPEFSGRERVTTDRQPERSTGFQPVHGQDGRVHSSWPRPLRQGRGWPMFRGGQGLLGRAPGALPDSMVLVWKFKTDGAVKSSPAIDDGLVFIGSDDGNIYAIDLKTGDRVWAYKTGDAVEATPCVVDGLVFTGSSDAFLYALDAKSGSLKWKYQTDAQILGAANWTRSPSPSEGRGSPDGQRTWILVGSYDNKLYCMDSANGRIVWTYETDSYINGSPAVGDGKVIFGGCDAMIHVVSVADGSKVTQIDAGSFIAASAAIFEGQVYVGNYDNVFINADIAAGEIVWRYTDADAPFFSSPAVGRNVVVFGGRDRRLHCVGRNDGSVVWTFQTLGEVDSSPVICGDKVVVGSEDGRLYIIRLSDGSEVWSYEIGQPVTSSPAVAGGMVVVGSNDGYVYAFAAGRSP